MVMLKQVQHDVKLGRLSVTLNSFQGPDKTQF